MFLTIDLEITKKNNEAIQKRNKQLGTNEKRNGWSAFELQHFPVTPKRSICVICTAINQSVGTGSSRTCPGREFVEGTRPGNAEWLIASDTVANANPYRGYVIETVCRIKKIHHKLSVEFGRHVCFMFWNIIFDV